MADTAAPNGNGAQDGDLTPAINALAQYTKDLSFENPNAPRSLQPQEGGPQINIQVNVNASNSPKRISRSSCRWKAMPRSRTTCCSSSN